MAVTVTYAMLIFIVWSAPTLLTLSRYTYGITAVAHFGTFLASVVLFVLMGRSLGRRQRSGFFPGLIVGALVGVAGTAVSNIVRRLPLAERTFVSQTPGVPASAALTMLRLHFWTSAILSAVMFAVLFGGLGAIATWWGGRGRRPLASTDPAQGPDAT